MKATAIAPANIAFIKFLGKTNEELRLPTNSSISMCLSSAVTTTTVEFSPDYKKDEIKMRGERMREKEKLRVGKHLDRIRKLAKINYFAKVVTKNNFPKGSGIASSASGFAALTLAATQAAGLSLSQKELTILSRLASGSAARSIPDGFVEWRKGESSETSYAYSLYPPHYWEIEDILVIIEEKEKKVGSTEAHKLIWSSPFFKERLARIEEKIARLKVALKKRNFGEFGEIVENEALNIHAVLITTTPPIFYWSQKTVELMLAVWSWRRNGLPVYFTIDAGPNIHLLAEEENKKEIVFKLKKIKGVSQIIINKPGRGARLIPGHLF